MDNAPIALTMGQQFEIERFGRAIDATSDPQALRGIAKQLLMAWHSQKAATNWIMRQQAGRPWVKPSDLPMPRPVDVL